MTVSYTITVYSNSAGTTKLSEISEFYQLVYQKKLNEPGYMRLMIDKDHPVVSQLALDSAVVVNHHSSRLVSTFSPVTKDFVGIFRGSIRPTTIEGVETVELHCPDGISILTRAVIGYRNTINSASVWTATPIQDIIVDIIGKNFVNNFGPFRVRAPLGVSFMHNSPPMATGSTINYSNAGFKNVYEAIKELVAIDGIEFDVTFSPSGFFFQTYNALGTNKTSTIYFNVGLGNLATPILDTRRINENTVGIVGGTGTGTGKIIRVRNSFSYSNPTNERELYIDASNISDTAELQLLGDTTLESGRQTDQLRCQVIQTPSIKYPEDYKLGDIISIIYANQIFNKKIVGVVVTISPTEGETIEIELSDD